MTKTFTSPVTWAQFLVAQIFLCVGTKQALAGSCGRILWTRGGMTCRRDWQSVHRLLLWWVTAATLPHLLSVAWISWCARTNPKLDPCFGKIAWTADFSLTMQHGPLRLTVPASL